MSLFLVNSIYGQVEKNVTIIEKGNKIKLPDATFIKEIKIKTKWFRPLKPTSVFLKQAVDSTRHYGGNIFKITHLKEFNYFGYPIIRNEKRTNYLRGEVYLLSKNQISILRKDQDSIRIRNRIRAIQRPFYVGLSVGPETAMGLPKASFYVFQKRKAFDTYYGVEGSLWFIEALWLSTDFLYGVQKGFVTFDISTGAWWYPYIKEYKTGPYFHVTLNPKLGIRVWKIWLKAGPSFFLYKDYAKGNKPGVIGMTKIGKLQYNFEIQFKFN